MATTTNYLWDKPTVLGDVGAWGTKLNVIFDSIDSQVKTNDTAALAAAATALAAANVAKAETLAIANYTYDGAAAGEVLNGASQVTFLLGTGARCSTAASILFGFVAIPLLGLVPGFRIGTFSFKGNTQGNTTIDVGLYYTQQGSTGETQVGATVSLASGAGEATSTSAALAHDVVAGRSYYLKCQLSKSVANGNFCILRTAWLSVTRP